MIAAILTAKITVETPVNQVTKKCIKIINKC